MEFRGPYAAALAIGNYSCSHGSRRVQAGIE